MKTFLLILFSTLLLACSSRKAPTEEAFLKSTDSLNQEKAVTVDEEVVSSILQQIPSPLEISMLLKQSGARYNSNILNAPANSSKYNTSYQKALNLGIYGADLGYANIYEKNIDGIRYLSSIKSLADDLNIGQFFDVETIGKLATSSNNLDSLLLLTTQNFNSINQYLQNRSRANLSVLLLVGGWVEAMEIICQLASQNPNNKELMESIGAQKIIVEQIAILLSFYEADNNIALLSKEFKELKTIFDAVSITYTYKESTMEIVDGVAIIKDNSTSTINITAEDTIDIKNKIGSIRTRIIS